MLLFEAFAEQKIAEAINRGDFENLPGSGQPLNLDDDPLIPEDQRMATRILKNAGFTPPEVGARRQIAELTAQLELLGNEEKSKALKRLHLLMTQLSLARGESANLLLETEYFECIKQKLAGEPAPKR